MSRCLNRKRRNGSRIVQANRLVNDIFITAHITVMFHADALDKTRQTVACDRIRDNRAARIILRDNRRHHRNNRITVYLVAVWKDRRHTVNVRIKDNTQICLIAKHRLSDGLHRLLIFRVRNMVWKMSVRLQKLTARRIRTKRI